MGMAEGEFKHLPVTHEGNVDEVTPERPSGGQDHFTEIPASPESVPLERALWRRHIQVLKMASEESGMYEEMLSTHSVDCPYCGTGFELLVDGSQGSHATWEDCPRCCSPIQIGVEVSAISGELERLTLGRDDDVL